MKTQLIVFTRYPEPGNTKTRLIPSLGPEGAAILQQRLTSHTLDIVRTFQRQVPCTIEVRFAGRDATAMQAMFGDGMGYVPQQGTDLGERLCHAIDEAFQADSDRVIVIGADCPQLDATTLQMANRLLERHDVVVGPAEDGGYYLIGLKSPQPSLFREIPWGTSRVLTETMKKIDVQGLSRKLLSPLSDVDYPEDLISCRRWPQLLEGILPAYDANRLSIVIPTLNEVKNLAETLHAVNSRCTSEKDLEVIVADGGSKDDTVQIALQHQAKVVQCKPGRGIQLNAGAALASGGHLLFLHADALLPFRYDEVIRNTLHGKTIAGAFRLKIDHDTPGLRLVAQLANLRSRFLQRPYGDQGLFLRSQTLYEVGGFRNWPLMEDIELGQRLRKRGRIAMADVSMTVSARRWRKRGVVRTTCMNQAILLAWRMGISPERLALWYRGKPVSSS
ncbi:TIGR04283 family arsenosugar biosynthesis glycosyltransferase [Bremerella volcania]|nr:TIGR04283 family arsenosugar biosynthesis glycosyltransferase [Bremerella volcania]